MSAAVIVICLVCWSLLVGVIGYCLGFRDSATLHDQVSHAYLTSLTRALRQRNPLNIQEAPHG